MAKDSADPVVEHKGIVGHAAGGVRTRSCFFSALDWQTESRVGPPIVRHGTGGSYGAENV